MNLNTMQLMILQFSRLSDIALYTLIGMLHNINIDNLFRGMITCMIAPHVTTPLTNMWRYFRYMGKKVACQITHVKTLL